VPPLNLEVLATLFLDPLLRGHRGGGEGKRWLPTRRQIETPLPGIAASLLNELFALGPGDVLALAPDDAVDALAVDHDVDGITGITIRQALGRNAVLGDGLAGLEAADRGAVKLGEAQGHGLGSVRMLMISSIAASS
jgi:hypothetical protein